MRKIYFLGTALLFSGFVSGQMLNNIPPSSEKIKKISLHAGNAIALKNSYSAPALQAAIWSEDFGSGFPAGWTLTDVAGNGNWTYVTPTTSGISASAKLNSTTKANGYMTFNSDSMGNDSKPEEAFFKTSAINLTGNPVVSLFFQQQFSQYYATTTVTVSDGTNSQTFTINDGSVNPSVSVNGNSPNPEIVIIDISAIAGNKPNVTIEFRWKGDWDYWWQVDDISISEPPPHDLSLTEHYFNGYEDSTATRYYTMVPKEQAFLDTLLFGGAVKNQGSALQANVKLKVDVTGPGAFSFKDSSATDNIPASAVDSFNVSNLFSVPSSPSDTGVYTITFTVSSDSMDSNPGNNSAVESFRVTDTIYARDNGMAAGGSWFGDGKMFIYGNLFKISTLDTATSISLQVGDFIDPAYDPVGKTLVFSLYDFATDPPTLLSSSDFYTTVPADLGKWLTLAIPATELTPGFYLAAFETYSDTVLFLTTEQAVPPLAVFGDVDKDDTWFYYTDGMPLVRLNTGKPAPVGILENVNSSAINIFPNPGKGIFNVQLVNAKGNYSIAVKNMLGQTVYAENTTFNGNSIKTIDLSTFNRGVYFLLVTGSDINETQKLIVK